MPASAPTRQRFDRLELLSFRSAPGTAGRPSRREAAARGGGTLRSCLPVSNPPASGLSGMTATPSSSHSGSSPLEGPEQQIISGLDRDDARALLTSLRPRPGHLVRLPVGNTDVSGLAAAHDLVESVQGLIERCLRVVAMELVDVDIVRAKASERGIDGVQDMLAGQTLFPGLRSHDADALRGHDELGTLALQPPTGVSSVCPSVARSPPTDRHWRYREIDFTRRRGIEDRVTSCVIALEPGLIVPRQSL